MGVINIFVDETLLKRSLVETKYAVLFMDIEEIIKSNSRSCASAPCFWQEKASRNEGHSVLFLIS